MSDIPQSEELVQELLGTEGVSEITIHSTIEVTHRKEPTGETDDCFNDIRERVISEDELGDVAETYGAEYHGTVDVPNEFKSRDRFTISRRFGGES